MLEQKSDQKNKKQKKKRKKKAKKKKSKKGAQFRKFVQSLAYSSRIKAPYFGIYFTVTLLLNRFKGTGLSTGASLVGKTRSTFFFIFFSYSEPIAYSTRLKLHLSSH